MQNSATYSVPSWQKRMIRWCKLRLKLSPMSWFEPIQECFMLGLATSWTVNYLFGWNSLVFFLIHVLGWFLSDYMLLKIVQVKIIHLIFKNCALKMKFSLLIYRMGSYRLTSSNT